MHVWIAAYILAGWLVASVLTAQVLAILFRGASMGPENFPAPRRSIDLRYQDLVPMGQQRSGSVIS
jgi:hypothetical protein